MNAATYERLGQEFDRLFFKWPPADEESVQESAEWQATLDAEGVTEDEWAEELDRRLRAKGM